MNTSNISPKQTPQGSSDCNKANTFAYRVGSGIYLNITNRCNNNCEFCIRRNGEGAYGSESLWLEHEPGIDEILDAVEKVYFPECTEFVYCGYGEPTYRLCDLLISAALLKKKYALPVRLNTNGLANLLYKTDTTPVLRKYIDTVSISLNAANAEEYNNVCHPKYGLDAFPAIIEYARGCVRAGIPNVLFSVVEGTIPESDIAKCREIAENVGAKLRIRKYIG